MHLALADVVDDRLEVLPSKGPNQGLHHHLLKKVKLGILLDHLGDLSSTFLCHQMDAKLSSLWVGRQRPHLLASTWMALLLPCPQGPHHLLLRVCRPSQTSSFVCGILGSRMGSS